MIVMSIHLMIDQTTITRPHNEEIKGRNITLIYP